MEAQEKELLVAAKWAIKLLTESVNHDENDPETRACCRALDGAIFRMEGK